MSKKLETRVEKLEALSGDPEPELLDLVWSRDRVPVPGELVISWLPEYGREGDDELDKTS